MLFRSTRPGTLTVRAFQLLICSLLISAPLWSLYQTFQLHADAVWYAKLWDRRDRRLRAARQAGQSDVVVDPLPDDLAIPGSIAGIPQISVAEFYGFRSAKYVRPPLAVPESWTQESWTRVTVPELVPRAIRGILKGRVPDAIFRILRRIRKGAT